MSEIYEGNSITVNNINKSKAKINIRGGSWQETRSGKNKFYGKFTPQVKEGISLIVNSDDTILINGTNNLGNLVYNSSTFSLKAGTYIASGMPDGTSIYDVYIQFAYLENEEKKYVTANGTKFTLLEDKDNVVCYIGFKQGKTANNIILKPMLREATIEDDTYEQYGASPSPEFPSEIENVENDVKITVCNKNIFNGIFTTNGNWQDDGTINYVIQSKLYWRTDFIKIPNKNIYFSSKQSNIFSSAKLLEFDADKKYITSNKIYQVNSNLNKVSLNENTKFIAIQWNLQNEAEIESLFTEFQIEVGLTATSYIQHEEQTIIFPLEEGQKLYEGSYLAKDGIHNVRKQATLKPKASQISGVEVNTETKNTSFLISKNIFNNLKKGYLPRAPLCNKLQGIASKNYRNFNNQITQWYDTSADFCAAIQTDLVGTTSDSITSYLNNNQFVLEYFLENEEIIPYTQKQKNAFYQLQNILLYDGINYIFIDNELGSMSVEVLKIIEDYETYISSNGFFINSQNDIHYLIDFNESEFPCMAEATETTVKAAGRNGDIVLSTTYDPNTFNIVCYTEDNLTQEEKVKEEMKLKKLLNSIKNKTIPLAFEKDDKFYKVKYSGAFSSTNFPKHLKFSIPLKTSESYGKDLIKKVILGNGEETSDTFEDVGAIFTINGPANSPIISLNDYSIEYDNPLLEGDKLVINSSNSTITHINSDGVKTNAMRYYNHQFPKIENGKNVLKVLSGVDENNVSVEWYDYKF